MTPEQTAKAEIINDRLNALSASTRNNLASMREINDIIFGTGLSSEKTAESKAPIGWFENVIEMLATTDNCSHELKVELAKLRKEFKK